MIDQISTKEIYELINGIRTELTEHILRLEGKIDIIESNHLLNIKADLEKIKAEFSPIRSLVYGLVGITMTAVIGALLFLILK